MGARRSAVLGVGAVLAFLAAFATRWISPAPLDEARLKEAARQALAADAPLDFSQLSRKLCFLARADLLAAHMARLGAERLDGAPPQSGAVILVFLDDRTARPLQPDRHALAWDPLESGGAFCAASARVSPTTSGGLYLTDFQGVSQALAPQG